MPELDDHELLAEFTRNESETAFAALKRINSGAASNWFRAASQLKYSPRETKINAGQKSPDVASLACSP
jgi:hypothetical protein